jgi:cbb3-type cytochrome oxidase maturation protein
MDIIFYLLPIAIVLGGSFLIAFLYAVKSGQFDDLDTPAHRILIEDDGGECDKQN